MACWLINLLGENGIITDEKDIGNNAKKSSFRVLEAKNVKKLLLMGGPSKRDSTTEKKFNLGETVSVRTDNVIQELKEVIQGYPAM